MDLPKTIELIRKAWCAAENKLVEEVGKHNPGLGEEGITERLFVRLQEELENANKAGLVEDAFVADLSNAHPDIRMDRVENFSQGLIAEVLHNRHIEGTKTGGDFGLIMSSPEVERSAGKLDFFQNQNRQGLLCQAKLKRQTWRQLTGPQMRILPKHLKYSAMALYCYEDVGLRQLRLGQWFSCKSSSVDKINEHLRNNFRRTRLKNSAEILNALAEMRIGTRDSNVINEFIAPSGSRYFELRIWWKDKGDRFSELINSAKLKEELKISVTGE